MKIFRTLFIFLSVQFFLYNMGLLTTRLSLFLSFISLVIFVLLSIPDLRGYWKNIYILPAFCFFIAIIVIALGVRESIFIFPLFLSSMTLLPKRNDHHPGEREELLVGIFIYAVVVFIIQHVPAVWHAVQGWGFSISKFSGSIIGLDYLFGHTAAGVSIFLMFLSYHIAVAVRSRQSSVMFLIRKALLMILIQVAVMILLTPFAILVQYKLPVLEMLLFNPEGFIFVGLIISLRGLPSGREKTKVFTGDKGDIDTARQSSPISYKSGFQFRTTISTAVIAVLCAFFITLRVYPGDVEGRVVIYDRGYLNFKVPVYGRYGHKSGGMFGNLPRVLEASGYLVERADSLTPQVLERADAVVTINVLEFFSQAEKEATEEFVRSGGSLLALGDHTGVKGIREPFNDLLQPYGIEFNFDSATFLTKGWGGEAVTMPHPVTHGLYDPAEMDIWVGASLTIDNNARPLVVARYGYSDVGDMSAFDHAYLGNRIYDSGEQLGDLVLVASAEYGRGKVMVFGDTSPFQNSAMVSSYRFVNRVFSWLTSGGNHGSFRSFILPLIVVALAVFAVAYGDIVLVGIVSTALLVGTLIGYAPRKISGEVSLDMPTAYIDASHAGLFDKLTWYDDCLGGMQYNLMRAGYFPLLVRHFSEQQLRESSLAVIVAPVKEFSGSEIESFDSFMRRGGWVLYSCGFEESRGSEEFLDRYGIGLLNLPLTTYVDSVMGESINIKEGWCIETGKEVEVIAERFDYPYIVKRQVGGGGLILIADTYFFMCKNLEGIENYYPGNINFLRKLIGSITGGTVDGSEVETEDTEEIFEFH
jgi:hypothetical protein